MVQSLSDDVVDQHRSSSPMSAPLHVHCHPLLLVLPSGSKPVTHTLRNYHGTANKHDISKQPSRLERLRNEKQLDTHTQKSTTLPSRRMSDPWAKNRGGSLPGTSSSPSLASISRVKQVDLYGLSKWHGP